MHQVSILISEGAFIIKKGLQFILNEIDNYSYNFYNPDNTNFKEYIKNQKFDILICNNSFFEINKGVILKNKLKVIILDFKNKGFSNYFINTFECDKSTIISILQEVGKIKNDKKDKIEKISEREISVVECVAKGMINKEIADALFISQHTVITHRKNITRKLGIKTVSGLTVYAILNNIIDINEVN
jgi:DNA-binding CsgD family transcriptional regulator